jgi:CBS domain containing-hemolysin-like protein
MRLKTFVDEKKRGAKKALWIAEHYDRTLTTLLVGNNFVNIAASTISVAIFAILIKNPTLSNVVSTVVMTIIVLIFGEILPKSFAKEKSETIALRFANILYLLMKILYPIVIIFIGIKKLVFSKVGKSEQPTVTESELETIIDTMESEGVIDSDDADLMQSVLDISERTIYDIMTPRVDIIGIDIEMEIDQIKDIFFKHKFSRMPVYREDKDHIIGILSERDFYTALLKGKKAKLETLVTEPLYVSKTMKVDDLIRLMQKEKKHFAIVSDEYGGTSGIVTMEDALEELVGEIYDEHDDTVQDEEIVKIEENIYEVSAEMPVEDLFEILELGKAPDSSYTSVGGFLYSLAEDVPSEGEELEWHTTIDRNLEDDFAEEYPITLKFTILSVIERRIMRTKLEIIEDEKEQEDKEN